LHGRCILTDGGFRVCAAVIQEMRDGVHIGGGGSGDLGGEGSQGDEEGGIHGTVIVEECTHNSLGASDILRGRWRGFIWEQCILNVLAIGCGFPVVRGILWTFGHGLMAIMQCIFDKALHGKIKMHVVFIFPF
jgi:hypothetical protein